MILDKFKIKIQITKIKNNKPLMLFLSGLGIIFFITLVYLISVDALDGENSPTVSIFDARTDYVSPKPVVDSPPKRFETDVVFDDSRSSALHYEKNDSYHIFVGEAPFEEARLKAEQEFLRQMAITEEEACELFVFITTAAYVNPEEAGKNYTLSFCNHPEVF